jgi:hypothetical protein
MEPKAFFIRNHSSSELHSIELSKLHTVSEHPKFARKEDFTKWCHDATTEHCFYSLTEPEHPGIRPSGTNRAKYLWGIVGDYDGAPEAINAALPTLKFGPGKAPTWVTTTFSNKARLIWAFEKPVPVFSPEVFGRFITTMRKDLKLDSILPGLDECIENMYAVFELGTDWRQPYGDCRVPNNVVMTALHDASERVKWKANGPEIPLDAVAAEVEKRWPNRWVGPLEPGGRGVRFWDPKADNPTGCTIREHGVQAWTGEAKFIPWHELLGEDFVKQYRANRIGGAIDGTYFDGMCYWRRDQTEVWRPLNTEAAKRHLNVLHGLSSESHKGQGSEVSQALTTIDELQSVDGAFPCLFIKEEIVRDGSQKYLNIGRAEPIVGTGQKREWGDGFPWIAAYLDGLFGEDQKPVFLSWLSYFYNNAVAGKPRKGQALFVAGPVGAGKTFLSQRVIGALVGGFQEATDYVLGNTNFNEQLFHAPVWAVDDAVISADSRRVAGYSQMVKKIVANPYQQYHAKFRKAVTFKWNGRLIVTLNDDPESITMLPDIELSILDKIVILRAADPGVSFRGAEEKVANELPYFADYLLGFEIPESLCKRPNEVVRFGHDSWHHPELLRTAKQSSASASMRELLNQWRKYYFRGVDKDEWKGNASELTAAMESMDTIAPQVGRVAHNSSAFGRALRKLIAQGTPWITYVKSNGDRVYRVARPTEEEGQ